LTDYLSPTSSIKLNTKRRLDTKNNELFRLVIIISFTINSQPAKYKCHEIYRTATEVITLSSRWNLCCAVPNDNLVAVYERCLAYYYVQLYTQATVRHYD